MRQTQEAHNDPKMCTGFPSWYYWKYQYTFQILVYFPDAFGFQSWTSTSIEAVQDFVGPSGINKLIISYSYWVCLIIFITNNCPAHFEKMIRLLPQCSCAHDTGLLFDAGVVFIVQCFLFLGFHLSILLPWNQSYVGGGSITLPHSFLLLCAAREFSVFKLLFN